RTILRPQQRWAERDQSLVGPVHAPQADPPPRGEDAREDRPRFTPDRRPLEAGFVPVLERSKGLATTRLARFRQAPLFRPTARGNTVRLCRPPTVVPPDRRETDQSLQRRRVWRGPTVARRSQMGRTM